MATDNNTIGLCMIVKDEAGRLKEVTRIEGDEVYWRYTEGESPAQEMATDYEEFIDHHFIVPQTGTPRKSA